MAEFLEALGTVWELSLTTQSTLTLFKQYRKAMAGDSRFETLYWNIRTQKRITDGWIANRKLNPGNVPPEEEETVKEILRMLKEVHAKVEYRLSKAKSSIDGKTKPSLIKRLSLVSGGYDELSDYVDLFKALNEALRTIAPPLPGYFGGDAVRGGTSAQSSDVALSQRSEEVPNSRPLGDSSRRHDTIELLSKTCITSLAQAARSQSTVRPQLGKAEDRLSLWASGIYDNQLCIDLLQSNSTSNNGELRDFVLNLFVEIAFTLKQMLSRWLEDLDRPDHVRLEDCRNKLTAALAEEDVKSLTLEKWQIWQVEKENGIKYDNEGDVSYINLMIQALFDVLPALRNLRQQHILRQEAKQREQVVDASQEDTVITPPTRQLESSEKLINDNLAKMKSIEEAMRVKLQPQNDDDAAMKQLAVSIDKTTRRLEEWKANADADKLMAARARTRDVEKEQRKLASELDRFWDANGKTVEFSPSASSQVTQEKQGLVRSVKGIGPKDLEALLEICDEAIRHLYATTN